MNNKFLEKQYTLVCTSGGFFEENQECLFLSGADSLEFLHRISTNSLIDLTMNSARYTVLQTEKARIIDLVTAVRKPDGVLLVTSKKQSELVKQWLDKFIVTERIEIINNANEYSTVSVIVPKKYAHDFKIQEICTEPSGVTCFLDPLWKNVSLRRIIGPRDIISKCVNNLRKDFPFIDENIFESMRIEEGIPCIGKELTEQVNPLEAGIESQISFTKGCYIGQEVIARIDTYKKLQKKMSGFIIDSAEPLPLLDGSGIFQLDKEIGRVTSSAWSYGLKRTIALGYIQTSRESGAVEIRNSLFVNTIEAKTSDLPFEIPSCVESIRK